MAKNFEFFGAPVGLIFTLDREMGPPQWSDVGMFMQTFMLLAREQGLHTCPQEAWANWAATCAEVCGIPSNEIGKKQRLPRASHMQWPLLVLHRMHPVGYAPLYRISPLIYS